MRESLQESMRRTIDIVTGKTVLKENRAIDSGNLDDIPDIYADRQSFTELTDALYNGMLSDKIIGSYVKVTGFTNHIRDPQFQRDNPNFNPYANPTRDSAAKLAREIQPLLEIVEKAESMGVQGISTEQFLQYIIKAGTDGMAKSSGLWSTLTTDPAKVLVDRVNAYKKSAYQAARVYAGEALKGIKGQPVNVPAYKAQAPAPTAKEISAKNSALNASDERYLQRLRKMGMNAEADEFERQLNAGELPSAQELTAPKPEPEAAPAPAAPPQKPAISPADARYLQRLRKMGMNAEADAFEKELNSQ